jgi:hypothetical protein
MKRIAFAVVAAVGLAFGSGSALAQHGGGGHGGGGGGMGGGGYHGGGGGAYHGGGGYYHGGGGHYYGGHYHGYYPYFGFAIGFPYWGLGYGYPYYGYPYYASYPYSYPTYSGAYYSAPASYSDAPAYDGGYTQRDMTSVPQSQGQVSYYCTDPAGYYPQVQSCNRWLRVLPDSAPPTPH